MSLLSKARQLVATRLKAPEELKSAVSAAAESSGLSSGGLDWQSTWSAVCQVIFYPLLCGCSLAQCLWCSCSRGQYGPGRASAGLLILTIC